MHNKIQTKEVDWTHSKRRITIKNGNGRENDRKKIKRKTKTNDAGLDDGVLYTVIVSIISFDTYMK